MSNLLKITAPSLQVLLTAELENIRLGNENLGFLSASNGFMPKGEPLKSLPHFFNIWDTISAETPELIKQQTFRKTIESMPVLLPTENNLPEEYLYRAAVVLGFFAHAYANSAGELLTQDDVPDSVMIPWKIVSTRLHRPEPFLSYFDLIAYNWQYKAVEEPNKSLENMELLYPIFNCAEERNLYLIQTEMMANASPMVKAVADAQNATLHDDHELLSSSLDILINCLKHIANVSFAKLAYNKRSKSHLDPVVFTKTMMSFAVPIKEDIPGPSGTSFPYAHLVDILIGRKIYDERISKEALNIRRLYPPHVKRFLNAVAEISLEDYIRKSGSANLINKYVEMVSAYSGEKGFLNTHRKRVYSFVQTSFKVGRPQTIGGFDGDNEDEWNAVNTALQNMQNERPKCPFAQKSSAVPVAKKEKSKSICEEIENPLSLSELAEHTTAQSGYWVLMNDKILDITSYLKKHPGGDTSLLEYVGSSITKEFDRIHSDSIVANKILSKLTIGNYHEPKFVQKNMQELWEAQKELLFKIVELQNVYLLETSVQDKACFPNDDDHSQNPYKSFLKKNSNDRLHKTYIIKIKKCASRLIKWMNTNQPNWNQECPYHKMTKQFKRLTSFHPKPTSNTLDFNKLKSDALALTKILENENPNATSLSLELQDITKHYSRTITKLA